MKKSYLLIILFIVICSLSGYGQQSMVKGKVVEQQQKAPLTGAHVILEDVFSGSQFASVTDKKGEFVIMNVRSRKVRMTVSFLGFKEFSKEINLMPGFNNLGEIRMQQTSSNLEEVSIKKAIPLAVVKEDTIEYKSDAYKTTPDADAGDLVAKMPGVEVEEGSVKAQGEEVEKFLVDGKPFFNSDPSLALRNLPAEIIERVQIYEEQSEQSQFTGFDDGNSIKTMNVITRRNMRNGQFGKFLAGVGPEEKYAVSGNINHFKGDRRITLIGQSNNVNQQDFSVMDLLGSMNQRRGGGKAGGSGMGPGGGMGTRMGGGMTGGSEFMVGKKDGVSTLNSVGLNYTDSWGENISTTLNYFYNHVKNYTVSDLSRQYLQETLNNQIYNELDEVNSLNGNHRIFARIDFNPNERNRIMFRPNFNFQNNEYNSLLIGENLLEERISSATESDFDSWANAISGSADLLFMHRFEKAGRSVSLNLRTNISDRNGENYLLALNDYYLQNNFITDSLDQFSETDMTSNSVSTRFAYTEPLTKNGLLQFAYSYSKQKSNSDRLTRDFDSALQEYLYTDSTVSGIFENLNDSHRGGISYRYRNKGLMLMAGVDYENIQLNNDQQFPNPGEYNFVFHSVLPNAMLNWRGDQGRNLRLMYRSRSDVPSVEELQEVVDNTNSLQLSIGNPALRRELSHSLILRYSSANIEKSSLFYAGARISVDQDHISSSVFLPGADTLISGVEVPAGTQLTMKDNMNGFYSGSFFLTYGIPLEFIHCNLNINGSVNQSRTPGIINGESGYSLDRGVSFGLALVSNISYNLDFSVSSTATYNIPVSSFNSSLSENYFFQLSRLKLRWIMPKGFVFDSRITYSLYNGLSEGYDQNFMLWNLSLGKKIFKNQRGEVSVSVSDLLNENEAVSRIITESYIEDTQKNVIDRFFMLNFRYDLRKMKF